MNKRLMKLSFSIFIIAVTLLSVNIRVTQAEPEYYRIVVFGDPHLPYKPALDDQPKRQEEVMIAKNNLREQVNAWQDVSLVVAVGDITGGFGTVAEYAYAKDYFSRLRHPYTVITGNHDFMYADGTNLNGKNFVRTVLDLDDYIYADIGALSLHWPWAKKEVRQQKLDRFRRLFSLDSLYYSKRLGPCLLIFLSPDMVSDNKYQLQFSHQQLEWLRAELAVNKNMPTIVFSHAPLKGTLHSNVDRANTVHNTAQPHKILRDIIQNNPQLFMWVSGHMHLPATHADFASTVNVLENQVTNIHNADLDRVIQWTNSIYIYSDRVVVRTFNHSEQTWIATLERTLPFPVAKTAR